MIALVAAGLWLVAANVAGMIPSRTGHRHRAAALMVTALPTGAWVFVASGPLWGAVFVLASGSILRVPLAFLLGRVVGRGR